MFAPAPVKGESQWHDQRRAAFRGEPSYDRFVGPGYPVIPRGKVANGFAKVQPRDAYVAPAANLPRHRKHLGAYRTEFNSDCTVGYHVNPEMEVLEMAPDQNQRHLLRIGLLGRMHPSNNPLETLPGTNIFVGDAGPQNIELGIAFEPRAPRRLL